jgi:hypothetical protein
MVELRKRKPEPGIRTWNREPEPGTGNREPGSVANPRV